MKASSRFGSWILRRFSVGSMTEFEQQDNVLMLLFIFETEETEETIHHEYLLQLRDLSLLLKNKKKKTHFLLFGKFYACTFWTVGSWELFLTPLFWFFTGKLLVIVSASTSFTSFSVGENRWWIVKAALGERHSFVWQREWMQIYIKWNLKILIHSTYLLSWML